MGRSTSQVRDISAYLITCVVTLKLLWDAQFAAKEAGLLIAMYGIYLAVCVYTSRWADGWAKGWGMSLDRVSGEQWYIHPCLVLGQSVGPRD